MISHSGAGILSWGISALAVGGASPSESPGVAPINAVVNHDEESPRIPRCSATPSLVYHVISDFETVAKGKRISEMTFRVRDWVQPEEASSKNDGIVTRCQERNTYFLTMEKPCIVLLFTIRSEDSADFLKLAQKQFGEKYAVVGLVRSNIDELNAWLRDEDLVDEVRFPIAAGSDAWRKFRISPSSNVALLCVPSDVAGNSTALQNIVVDLGVRTNSLLGDLSEKGSEAAASKANHVDGIKSEVSGGDLSGEQAGAFDQQSMMRLVSGRAQELLKIRNDNPATGRSSDEVFERQLFELAELFEARFLPSLPEVEDAESDQNRSSHRAVSRFAREIALAYLFDMAFRIPISAASQQPNSRDSVRDNPRRELMVELISEWLQTAATELTEDQTVRLLRSARNFALPWDEIMLESLQAFEGANFRTERERNAFDELARHLREGGNGSNRVEVTLGELAPRANAILAGLKEAQDRGVPAADDLVVKSVRLFEDGLTHDSALIRYRARYLLSCMCGVGSVEGINFKSLSREQTQTARNAYAYILNFANALTGEKELRALLFSTKSIFYAEDTEAIMHLEMIEAQSGLSAEESRAASDALIAIRDR